MGGFLSRLFAEREKVQVAQAQAAPLVGEDDGRLTTDGGGAADGCVTRAEFEWLVERVAVLERLVEEWRGD